MTSTVQDIYMSNATQKKNWQAFLIKLGINQFDDQELDVIEQTIGIYDGDQLVATGSIAGNIIKYVGTCVIGEMIKGARFNQLMTVLENRMALLGRFHQFVYTKPLYVQSFEHIGFKLLANSNEGALLEKGAPDVQDFLNTIPKAPQGVQKIGSVVVNANPFTIGHRYLIEKAASENNLVYVFVVNQDVSLFHTDERFELVKQGVKDLKNVVVVAGGDYIISYLTFPSYFITNTQQVIDYQTTIDARIFKNIIAPSLSIQTRYVGSEPLSYTTSLYNQALIRELKPEINVIIVPRIAQYNQTEIISARKVRQAIADDDFETWSEIVPETTKKFISQHLAELQMRIRKGQKINGN
ncbi:MULTISPECIES: [citrate (pro-3S)-lyase] ligase [Leuconostoc gelidum group]|uniref:[citrate (pro-3S)-lyase] ligase n=1 Tax=Leuconostoc gelidum group TaxID=3016637 RepID=UPI00027E6B9C|nr:MULTISPECIES: [citrate (pro-3S)-lyase] ligase [Leuconostoc gelidum group]AFS39630.1 [citrate [pro-3S]-lyase] ligase [Leuconostoc gelidum JB7]MBZ5953655.1 [citrate (pro-3S)-lyase] ligase [Leuconostoc gasicomitatum]MBZ5955171.1 [citrate (pro-3S)-lyase] ligase [Leuconostoc gasicomitatum]MBZ5988783.1 [citrate (pro-3S)-lyase] ligase [Leuconostoc gasicomitatum]MBZ5989771.1 [citrate (pro-3S)-lyase] ligase [Leuconostoc gasicomitatum]